MIVRLTEVRDDDGHLIMQMCCVCFAYTHIEHLWTCPHNLTWDMCQADGQAQGCTCVQEGPRSE